MLCLTRREGERVMIGDNIIVTVARFKDGKVMLGIDAPDDVKILREELVGVACEGEEGDAE